jgi:hypothetical protein
MAEPLPSTKATPPFCEQSKKRKKEEREERERRRGEDHAGQRQWRRGRGCLD